MDKEKYIKKILNLENKAKIKSLKNHLSESCINLRINSTEEFYDKFDVDSPETRDLSPELEEYLLDEVEKIDHLPNLKIHIHCPANFELSDQLIQTACLNHFEELALIQFHQNRKLLKKWITSLLGGTIFLGLCLLASNILHFPQFDSIPFCKVLSESFSIIGWVAIWEPASYLLYHSKQDKRKLRNCCILHAAEYVVVRE